MTADSIRAEVDDWAERGSRGFKAKGIAPHQLRALIDQAHAHGLPVTGHLGSGYRGTVNPRDAIEMGIDRVEHFLGGDALPADRAAYSSLEELDLGDPVTRNQVDRQIQRFLDHRVHFDATLTAYGYFADREPDVFTRWDDEMAFLTPYARSVVEARLPRAPSGQFERIYYVKRATLKRFYEAGGADLITLGTDHPSWGEFLSGFGAHRELHALVLAGIPEGAALRIATVNGAEALGVGDRLGTVEAGKYADLIVIRGNPLADITRSRNVQWVIRGGDLHDARALLDSVRGRLGPESVDQAGWWKGDARLSPSRR
jgi:imidazolonepropionase-like amidohydrolase